MTDCGVCIGGIDEFYSDYERDEINAEGDLSCEECREKIPNGHKYERASGNYDRQQYTHTTCLSCVEIRDVFSCGEGASHGDLWERMRDYVFPDLTTASKCLHKLSVPNRTRVILKWQQWRGLR